MPTEADQAWIPVKQAAKIAREYLVELIPEIPADDVSLEEIEPGREEWLVTLGYSNPHPRNAFMPLQDNRIYKRFRIDAIEGKVLSMNIHKA